MHSKKSAMKNMFIILIGVFLLFAFVVCCNQKNNEKQNEDIESNQYLDNQDGMINGEEWSLARLSDSFDKGLTLDDALHLFGDKPVVESDGDITVIAYGINSNDLYENGIRMTIIEMKFKNNVLDGVRIGFSTNDDF